MVINMNNNYTFKNGFSLFEAFVVMLIVSIFVALMANTVAHRPKAKVASEAHGRFECYYENNNLYQQMFTENSSTGRIKSNKTIKVDINSDGKKENIKVCEFTPPSYAKYMIIDAVGGGAGGSKDGGASEGQFVSTFYATIERKYYIMPGEGGKRAQGSNPAKNGGETLVYSISKDKDSDGEYKYNSIIVAAGGKALSSLENTTISDVLSCSITEWCTQEAFDCHITPTCQIVGGNVQVSFCRSKGSYITVSIPYKVNKKNSTTVEMGNPRYVVNNVYTTRKGSNIWVYHDISQFSDYNDTDLDPTASYRNSRPGGYFPTVDDPYVPSLYTMELLMNTTADGDHANPSNLHRLIESMQYKCIKSGTCMKDANVGQGGAKNQNGTAGGALFLW